MTSSSWSPRRTPAAVAEPCPRATLEIVPLANIIHSFPRPRPTHIHLSVTFPEEVRAGQTPLVSRLFKQVPGLLLFLFILE